MTKVCTKCGVEKSIDNFYFRKDSGKYRNECKECLCSDRRKYRKENKEKISIAAKKSREQNKEKIKKQRRLYRENNKEVIALRKKEYRKNNIEEIRKRKRVYESAKIQNDSTYKLKKNLKRRVLIAIQKQYGEKAYKTMDLLGCSIEKARKHLETQFTDGMSWENQGTWHIDHIIPCASFDLTDPEEQKKCFHYTNLQPLWAEDNLKKGAKLDYKLNKKEIK